MNDPDPEHLARAMEAEGVAAEFAPDVIEMWHQPRERWRPCCGMLCEPCVMTLARVVDRLRARRS